jgi:hypothetical protein
MQRRRQRAERPLDAGALELLREVLARGGTLELPAAGLSMIPSIYPGDRLVLGPLPPTGAEVGDVVAWARGGSVRVHRVVQVDARGVVTRGDALPQPDGVLAPGEILGRLITVRSTWTRRLRRRTARVGRRALRSVELQLVALLGALS